MATFKKGDRVRAVKVVDNGHLIGGRIYTVLDGGHGSTVPVRNEMGEVEFFSLWRFEPVLKPATKPKHGLPAMVLVYREKDGKDSYLIASEVTDEIDRDHKGYVGVYTLSTASKMEHTSKLVGGPA